MPVTSQLRTERDGPAWSITDQLLDILVYVTRAVNADPKNKRKIEPFAPQPKPGRAAPRHALSRADLAAWRHGRVPRRR